MLRKSGINLDEILVEQIARGANQTEAARIAGCHRKTVLRRLQDSDFKRQVESFRAAMLAECSGKLASALGSSIERLEYLMTKATPDAVQVAAAKSIADLCLKFKDLELERRLVTIEEQLNSMLSKRQPTFGARHPTGIESHQS